MVSAIKGDNVYKFFTWLISSLCMIMASLLGLLYWNVKDELKDTREINVIASCRPYDKRAVGEWLHAHLGKIIDFGEISLKGGGGGQ